jgi:hypothetical protein
MRHVRKAIIAFALAGLLAPILAACNTTDALTPQVDVGAGTQPGRYADRYRGQSSGERSEERSGENSGDDRNRRYAGETNRPAGRGDRAGSPVTSPVTQADADDIARSPAPETYRDRTYAQHPPVRQGSPYPSGSSLEAQADALQSGSNVSPASSGPPPVWNGQDDAASAARSSDGRGAPPRSASITALQDVPHSGQSPEPPSGQPSGQMRSASSQGAGNTIRFLPVIGAPVEAVTPLSRRLGSDARASGLVIRPSNDARAEEILKGYFSAFQGDGPKGKQVTIIYVWDVLDPAGNRLNRMQGQEVVPVRAGSRESDPWAAVPAATMELIAAKTISDYLNWRDSRRG